MDTPYIEGFRAQPQPAKDAVSAEEALDETGTRKPGYDRVLWQWSKGGVILRDSSYYTHRKSQAGELNL